MATQRGKPKFVAWPTNSIAVPIGSGQQTAVPQSATVGDLKTASFPTTGPDTMRRYCFMCSHSVHRRPPWRESYAAYCSTYAWKQIYGRELLYSGPLFTHQLSHLWIDFRELRDTFVREHNSDYFENSRQATYVHQEYARHNPLEFAGYG